MSAGRRESPRGGRITHLLGSGVRRLLRVLPRGIQRVVLRGCLWCSRRLFELISVIAEVYCDGPPKHRSVWGSTRFFLKHLRAEMTVLDVGCGNGVLTAQLGARSRLVLAYDRSVEQVRQAAQRHGRQNVLYWVGEAQAALPRGRVDAVVLSSLVSFLPDPRAFLRGLHEVTSMLLIRETRFDHCYTALLGRELGVRTSRFAEFTKDELVALVAETGWRVTDCWDTFDIFLRAEPLRERTNGGVR